MTLFWCLYLWALNVFHPLLWCFPCWFWTSNCLLSNESYHISTSLIHACIQFNFLSLYSLIKQFFIRHSACHAWQPGAISQKPKRLVIFPMSGNNTFGRSDFADLRFSFWSSEGVSHTPTVFLWKKLLRNVKQMRLCSLCKGFVFSCLFTVEKSKSN